MSQKRFKIDLGNSFSYLEYDRNGTLEDVSAHSADFKKLEKRDMNHLARLLSSRKNYIWLKANFTLPENYAGEDLGLYASYIHTASQVYINGVPSGTYGSFPPDEFTPGFVAHHYQLSKDDLIAGKDNQNTLYIKIWPGGFCSISQHVYIGNLEETTLKANFVSFFNSKIFLLFSGGMFVVFVLYTMIFIGLRKFRVHKEYINFALLNFYTIHFLLVFFVADVPFLTHSIISYFNFIKLSFFCGAFITVYFANNFIIEFLALKQSVEQRIIRLILLLIPCILTILAPNYLFLSWSLIVSAFFALAQFGFSIPGLIKLLLNDNTRSRAVGLLKGFAPILVCILLDCIIRFIFDYKALPYFTIYGWQFTIIVFLVYLVRNFTGAYIKNAAMSEELSQFNKQLEKEVDKKTKTLSEKNEILTDGLKAVANVQKNFLPPRKASFRGWDLAIMYKPLVDEVSGDLYDYYFTNSNLDGIGIFDVSGHGIPSGLMTILAKGIISQHFLNGITQSEPISEVLENINKTYIKEKVNIENYITGLLFRFSQFNSQKICSVEVANAGHPHPFLYNSEFNEILEIQYQDSKKQYGMIGIDKLPVSFPPVSFRMGVNDIIVCFTDGLTDSINIQREEFGKVRLIEIIKKYAKEDAFTILEKITQELKNFTNGMIANDDTTVIVLKRTDPDDFVEELPDDEFLEML